MEGQSSGNGVAVCFHFSGVRPLEDEIITSSVTLVAPAAHDIWFHYPPRFVFTLCHTKVLSFARTFTTSASSLGFECWVCLSADWAGMLIPSNSFVHCVLGGVWVRTSRLCTCLAWMSMFWLILAFALLVWFSFLGVAEPPLSLLLFGVFGVVVVFVP